MSRWNFSTSGPAVWLAAVALTLLVVSSPVNAQQASIPPLMEQINNGNWLPQQEAEKLRDDLYYTNSTQAYVTMLPALNVIGMRDGSEANFGKGYNVPPIWKDRMDSRTWVPTPSGDASDFGFMLQPVPVALKWPVLDLSCFSCN